jgi:hypothetical protein
MSFPEVVLRKARNLVKKGAVSRISETVYSVESQHPERLRIQPHYMVEKTKKWEMGLLMRRIPKERNLQSRHRRDDHRRADVSRRTEIVTPKTELQGMCATVFATYVAYYTEVVTDRCQ